MHWFDRMSQRVAESEAAGAPVGVSTRRSVLKGATLATLALPFVPAAVGQASAAGPAGAVSGGTATLSPERLPLESLNEFCSNCLDRSYGNADQMLKGCGPAPGGSKRLLKPKAPPKAPAAKKATPASAAKRLACQAKVMKNLNKELEGCRLHFCEGDSEPPTQPPSGGGGSGAEAHGPTCPEGTSLCSQTLCCYGNDACCACGATGDFVCCVSEIGCTCC